MKKFIILALMPLFTLLVSIGTTSCHRGCDDNTCYTCNEDSMYVADIATHAVVNPSFDAPEDAVTFAEDLANVMDLAFLKRDMGPDIMATIATVVKKKHGIITPAFMIKEYRDNELVYDSMLKRSDHATVLPHTEETDSSGTAIVKTDQSTPPLKCYKALDNKSRRE